MNNTGKRILTFTIGLPLVICIVIVPFHNHALLNLLILAFSLLGINEYYNMVSKKTQLFPKWIMIVFTAIFPIITYLSVSFGLTFEYILWIYALITVIFMGIESCVGKDFSTSIEKISLSSLGIFYTGFLISFLGRISGININKTIIFSTGDYNFSESSTPWIILFLVFVFLCDSAAWFFGILFGKGTRGFFKASPNKSLVGFIGGICSDIAFAVLFKYVLSLLLNIDIFPGAYWKIILLALFTSVAGIIGDLIESVFKRSCEIKDSGNLIPGRGGALDSIDSILIAAPVFYIAVHFLYGL
ncbi:MAG: phosphatidate cytidylyltransferase [Treponema sp.]|nr:phosphatidate cytidylyltransferase [Treponema sp.]